MREMNLDFDTWYSILQDAARARGVSVADVDAWREDFDVGKWPEQALEDEWGSVEEDVT